MKNQANPLAIIDKKVGDLGISEDIEKKDFDVDEIEDAAKRARATFSDEDLQEFLRPQPSF